MQISKKVIQKKNVDSINKKIAKKFELQKTLQHIRSRESLSFSNVVKKKTTTIDKSRLSSGDCYFNCDHCDSRYLDKKMLIFHIKTVHAFQNSVHASKDSVSMPSIQQVNEENAQILEPVEDNLPSCTRKCGKCTNNRTCRR